jgi:cell division control protein 6
MKARVTQGLFPSVLSEELLDLVVKQTQKSGDLRVGIDLLKRATLSAERSARRSIQREDICGAYEISKYLHLSYTIKTLNDEERSILKSFAERSAKEHDMNAGDVYKSLKETLSIGYTRFYEIVKKMDGMRLINLQYRNGKGRTRIITLRYDPVKVLEYLA